MSSSYEPSMDYDSFASELSKMFALCGMTLNDARARIFYEEFGATPGRYIKAAFRRVIESPPAKITAALIKSAIREVMPEKKKEHIAGCEYCGVGAVIPYVRVINGHPYEHIAKCPKCRKALEKHLPFYDEVMPHDILKPHRVNKDDDQIEIKRTVKKMTIEAYRAEGKREAWLKSENNRREAEAGQPVSF